MVKEYKSQKVKRKMRVRANILGTANRPRLSVFRSNKNIYVQVIDDIKRITLVSASSINEKKEKVKKAELSVTVANVLAEKMVKLKIKKIVFDRGPYKFHGRVKSLADTLRERGISF